MTWWHYNNQSSDFDENIGIVRSNTHFVYQETKINWFLSCKYLWAMLHCKQFILNVGQTSTFLILMIIISSH